MTPHLMILRFKTLWFKNLNILWFWWTVKSVNFFSSKIWYIKWHFWILMQWCIAYTIITVSAINTFAIAQIHLRPQRKLYQSILNAKSMFQIFEVKYIFMEHFPSFNFRFTIKGVLYICAIWECDQQKICFWMKFQWKFQDFYYFSMPSRLSLCSIPSL